MWPAPGRKDRVEAMPTHNVSRPLLVTGGNGLLGAACVQVALERGYSVVATHHARAPHVQDARVRWVRLEDVAGARRVVEEAAPCAVVHTAAMAIPMEVEQNPEAARAINVEFTRVLCAGAQAVGARFIHTSTDLVFDGARGDYVEEDAVAPISLYGRTKVDAEAAVMRTHPNHVVARTSLLLGPSPRGDRGVEEAMWNAVARGETPRLFVDEWRTPVAAACLARLLVGLVEHPFCGVLHTTGQEVFSRHALGLLVAQALGLPLDRMVPVTLAQSPPALPPRAPNTTLNTRRLRQLAPVLPLPVRLLDHLRSHPRAVSMPVD